MPIDPDVRNDALASLLVEYARMTMVKVLPIQQPAAGSEIVIAVPSGVVWELLTVKYVLNTSPVVATRNAALRILDADGNILIQFPPAATSSASVVTTYSFSAGFGVTSSFNQSNSPLPNPPLQLFPGSVIRTGTAALDAADQFQNIFLQVREWSEQQVELAMTLADRADVYERVTA